MRINSRIVRTLLILLILVSAPRILFADGMSALAAVDALKPEVVLLDIVLPDTDGLAIAATLAQRANAPAVVLTSSRERADFGRRLEQAPAKGFLHKDDLSGRALVSLVREHRVRS